MGADGEVPKLAASTVKNCVADPTTGVVVVSEEGVPLSVKVAVIVPEVMAIRTFCEAGGAFWCGFHNDGSNQAVN